MAAFRTLIFIVVIVVSFWYVYEYPILLPNNFTIHNIVPTNLVDSFNDTTKIEIPIDGIRKLVNNFSPDFDEEELEFLILDLTNEKRRENGLVVLDYDSKLAGVARFHSMDMKNRDFFSHDNPDGENPTQRGEKQGYSCIRFFGIYMTYGIAENIAKYGTLKSVHSSGNLNSYNWHTQESLANEIVNGWMNSPDHRKNILASNYEKLGVGVSIGEDGAVYATQNFC